ncbi:hypothetical protein F4820DRAFT_439213 [Hypoxylon rubiginosum]|uniref:Uncharacterized protein n=1 Tax=Hypoxylon rubiginosum TaxID=110542 RepID=A0ACB9YKZ3_9PEZI|nr:hypothetical protein F4820DRAFT_439213 [Hypoxylon rubiginosum]
MGGLPSEYRGTLRQGKCSSRPNLGKNAQLFSHTQGRKICPRLSQLSSLPSLIPPLPPLPPTRSHLRIFSTPLPTIIPRNPTSILMTVDFQHVVGCSILILIILQSPSNRHPKHHSNVLDSLRIRQLSHHRRAAVYSDTGELDLFDYSFRLDSPPVVTRWVTSCCETCCVVFMYFLLKLRLAPRPVPWCCNCRRCGGPGYCTEVCRTGVSPPASTLRIRCFSVPRWRPLRYSGAGLGDCLICQVFEMYDGFEHAGVFALFGWPCWWTDVPIGHHRAHAWPYGVLYCFCPLSRLAANPYEDLVFFRCHPPPPFRASTLGAH